MTGASGINLSPFDTDLPKIVRAIIQLFQGRSSAVGSVTLRANQTTTVVTKNTHPAAIHMTPDSAVFLSPTTAHAQAAAYSWWISSKGLGTFTITHASDANNDKTFDFEIRG